jgi:putative effector of murein hydrolase
MAALLELQGSQFPASVAVIALLGAAALPARSGFLLQSALGPGAAWLRAALPWLLVPAALLPVRIIEWPSADMVPKFVLTIACSVAITAAACGVCLPPLLRDSVPTVGRACRLAEAAAGTAAAAMSSVPLAAAAVAGGALASWWLLQQHAPTTDRTRVTAQECAPFLVGVTFAANALAARYTPLAVRPWLPPFIVSALCVGAVSFGAGSVWLGSGRAGVTAYVDGAGDQLIQAARPVLATFGLYGHTHRALLLREWRSMLALACLAPCTLFASALLGRALGLTPGDAACTLPATTTTALALMMPGGLPLIRTEWVALGTTIAGFGTALSLPLLLRATSLSARTPVVRGLAVGAAAHVSGVAALAAGGEIAAADAASVATVVVGVTRTALVHVPWVAEALTYTLGAVPTANDHEDAGGPRL